MFMYFINFWRQPWYSGIPLASFQSLIAIHTLASWSDIEKSVFSWINFWKWNAHSRAYVFNSQATILIHILKVTNSWKWVLILGHVFSILKVKLKTSFLFFHKLLNFPCSSLGRKKVKKMYIWGFYFLAGYGHPL